MAKTKKAPAAGLAFKDATEQQLATARAVIDDDKKHRYYVGRIYGMYNKITGKNEVAQNCASCLRVRAKAIAAWYNEGIKGKPVAPAKEGGVKVVNDEPVQDTGAPFDEAGTVAPPKETPVETGVEVVLKDGTSVIFGAPELLDGAKGIATTLDGKKVKAGTYETTHGHLVKVAVGGKATFSVVEDLT